MGSVFEEMWEYPKVNAPSLLLGYMRPLISNITNSSQYPTFDIPFLDMQENEAIFEEE